MSSDVAFLFLPRSALMLACLECQRIETLLLGRYATFKYTTSTFMMRILLSLLDQIHEPSFPGFPHNFEKFYLVCLSNLLSNLLSSCKTSLILKRTGCHVILDVTTLDVGALSGARDGTVLFFVCEEPDCKICFPLVEFSKNRWNYSSE